MRAFPVLGALLLALSACASSASSAPRGAGDPSARDAAAEPDRVELVVGGIPRLLPDGDPISVVDDLRGRVTLRRLADVRFARVLGVKLDGDSGPVEGASILVDGRMRHMDHGDFRVIAVAAGPGSYVAPLAFSMPGEWDLQLTIVARGRSGTVSLGLDVSR